MPEGSVIVDGTDTEIEETQSDVQEEGSQEPEVESEEPAQAETEETKPEQVAEPDGETKLTEKGTKLDSNPVSAAYQQLANERRKVREYEALLSNPERLAQVMPKKQEPQLAFKPEDMQSAEDVVKALNSVYGQIDQVKTSYGQKVEQLERALFEISEQRQTESVASSLQDDASRVRDEYPELNDKKPEYNKSLEKKIAIRYHELNYDPNLGRYTNKYSLKSIADDYMSIAEILGKKASETAQTIVKDKMRGRIVTSSKAVEAPQGEASIAGLISKAYKK